MTKRKAFLIRVDPALLDAMQRWADDELRSLNAQVEYVLRQSLLKAGRKPKAESHDPSDDEPKSPNHPGGTRTD